MNIYVLFVLLQIPSIAVVGLLFRAIDHARIKHAKKIIADLRAEKKALWVLNRTLIAESVKNGACDTPPAGWCCTREVGHEGPCAATPIPSATTGTQIERYSEEIR